MPGLPADPMTLPSGVRIRRITTQDDRALLDLRRLYEQSFPASEREEWDALVDQVTARQGLLFCAEEVGAAVAFAHFLLLPRNGTALISYTAAQGSPGVGSVLIAQSRQHLREAGLRGVLGEAERVEDAVDASDARTRRLRLMLHGRWGAEVLPVAGYGMPDLEHDGDHLLPLHLVWCPFTLPASALTGWRLRELVIEVYERAYRRRRGDALLEQVLAALDRSVAA